MTEPVPIQQFFIWGRRVRALAYKMPACRDRCGAGRAVLLRMQAECPHPAGGDRAIMSCPKTALKCVRVSADVVTSATALEPVAPGCVGCRRSAR